MSPLVEAGLEEGGRRYRLSGVLSVLLVLFLPVPEVANGKDKRPKRRNGIAAFAPGFTPEIGAFT